MILDNKFFMFGGLRDGEFLEASLHGLEVQNHLLKSIGLIDTAIIYSNQALESSNKTPGNTAVQVQEESLKQPKKGMALGTITIIPLENPATTEAVKSSNQFVSFKPLPDSFIEKKILKKLNSRYN
jgi:hypothetical protein